MKTKLNAIVWTCLVVLCGASLQAVAQTSGNVAPYTNDAYTVLLDHFDTSTSANILAFTNNGGPCGPEKPSVPPGYSYGSGLSGLSQALALYPPSGDSTRSYLKYPGGELLSQPNGTLECWIYLTNYNFSIHQLTYIGECDGDVGGLSVNPSGQLIADIWYTVSSTIQFDSGSNVIPLNTWTHLALSWGSTGAKLYINSALVGSHPNTGNFAHWPFGSNSVFGFVDTGGYIDELRISSVQRTNFNLFPATPASLAVQMYAGLTITGTPGASYQIQYSADLNNPTNWLALTNLTLPSSPYLFFDATSSSRPHSFYRALLIP